MPLFGGCRSGVEITELPSCPHWSASPSARSRSDYRLFHWTWMYRIPSVVSDTEMTEGQPVKQQNQLKQKTDDGASLYKEKNSELAKTGCTNEIWRGMYPVDPPATHTRTNQALQCGLYNVASSIHIVASKHEIDDVYLNLSYLIV